MKNIKLLKPSATKIGLLVLIALFAINAKTAKADFIASLQSQVSGRCADVTGASTANGAQVIQWSCHGGDNQRFRFEQFPNTNQYLLRAMHSNKCLEVPHNNTSNGTVLVQRDCHANLGQRWRLTDIGGAVYTLTSVQSNKLMDVKNGSTANGAQIHQWPSNGSSAQRWTITNRQDIGENPAQIGEWSEVINWPHIPVSAAALPNGNIVTWSSNEKTSFPVQDQMTYSSVFNPSTRQFQDINNNRHDMFCAGISLLPDGKVLASGGNPTLQHTSAFDGNSNNWLTLPYMNQTRWYGTNLSLTSGEVFSTFAKQANEIPEIYTPGSGWTELPDAHMQELLNDQNTVNANAVNNATTAQWYAFMHVAPDGRVFHPGPTKNMHWFDTNGTGDVTNAGLRNGETRHRQFGSSVMYDVGKILLSGGADRSINPASTASVMTIDINGASPVVNTTNSMLASRTNHESIVLPTGEVLIVGGNSNGILFSDADSVMPSEIWNPETGQWRTVDRINVPRNYHSIGILLQDGRVLAAGGGLCGSCVENHQDGQIYSPPYLFNNDGSLATRPVITNAPAQSKAAAIIPVSTNRSVSQFTMIRLSGVTHSINTDQRFIPVEFDSVGNNAYELFLHENPNVLIPGNYWLFAIDGNGTPSVGQLINIDVGVANQAPEVNNPGSQNNQVNDSISLQIVATDNENDSLNYQATGLPQGLSINSSTGLISGSAQTIQTTNVVISVSDSASTVSVSFTWTISSDNTGGDGLGDGDSASGNVAIGQWDYYTVQAGENVSRVLISLSGLTNDGDLYVRAGQRPSGHEDNGGIYDCGSALSGTSDELCILENNNTLTVWHIGVYGYRGTEYTVSVEFQEESGGGDDTPIDSGDSASDALLQGQWHFYKIRSTASDHSLTVNLTNVSNDIDLYVRAGSRPTGTSEEGGLYDCLSIYGGTSNERCEVLNTGATDWFIGVYGYRSGGYTLDATLNGSSGGDITVLPIDSSASDNIGLQTWHYYSVDVPANTPNLKIRLSDMNADGDLYVRENQKPSGTANQGGTYDCGSYKAGTTNERCELTQAGGKRYIIGVYGYQANSYTLSAEASTGELQIITLNNNQSQSASVDFQDWKYYKISVPASHSRLLVELTDQSADGDLFVRQGQVPSGDTSTGANSQCYSVYGGNSSEECILQNSGTTDWYIGVYGYNQTDFTIIASSSNNTNLRVTKIDAVGKAESIKEVESLSNGGSGGGSFAFISIVLLALMAVSRRRVGC